MHALAAEVHAMPLVREYMNPHLVYLRAGNRIEIALRPILDLRLTAVPILDDDHRPVGVVSLRDIAEKRRARGSMTERMRTIAPTESLVNAACVLADEDVHHLVVVGDDGIAVGMLSSLDVVRGLAGRPAKHPQTTHAVAIGDEDEVDSEEARVP
jgi:CBS-domain-containing membrane protein